MRKKRGEEGGSETHTQSMESSGEECGDWVDDKLNVLAHTHTHQSIIIHKDHSWWTSVCVCVACVPNAIEKISLHLAFLNITKTLAS